MASVLAEPGTSRNAPRLALVGSPTTLAVPLRVRVPLANGVPAVGRTRTFCQVNSEVWPDWSVAVTVNVSCVAVAGARGCLGRGGPGGSVGARADRVGPRLDRFPEPCTAFAVTPKPMPAIWALGVPVLPLALPGAAVSPGTRSCSLVNAAGL